MIRSQNIKRVTINSLYLIKVHSQMLVDPNLLGDNS